MRRVIQIVAALASLSVTSATAVAQRPTGYPRSYDDLIGDARAERQPKRGQLLQREACVVFQNPADHFI